MNDDLPQLPKPTGYVTENGLRQLRQDDTTILLYPFPYLIRPNEAQVFTADQMIAYARAARDAAQSVEPVAQEYVDCGECPAISTGCKKGKCMKAAAQSVEPVALKERIAELEATIRIVRSDIATLHMAQGVNNQNHPAAWHDAIDAALEAFDAALEKP